MILLYRFQNKILLILTIDIIWLKSYYIKMTGADTHERVFEVVPRTPLKVL